MKILLWNGMLMHYEMFGFIIEYCKTYNHTLDIKTRIVSDDNGATDLGMLYWYNVKFNNSFILVDKINIYDYDYIFLPTDDDFTIITELLQLKDETIFDRLIVIDNDFEFRNLWTKHHISTRYHPKRPLAPYVLPCYRVINKKEKRDIISKVANINIALIAPEIFNRDFKHIFNKYKNQVVIYQINYKIHDIPDKYKDIVRPYERLEQGYLEYILNSCQYILIPDNINIRKFFMSGAMALAYNHGCRLILPDGWKDDFKMDMAISNNENIELSRVPVLDDIFDERELFIEKRNKLFNRILEGETIYIDPDINFIPSKRRNIIPRKIYQIWVCDNNNDSLILPMKNLNRLWEKFNPTYEYTLIGNLDAKRILTENFDESVYTAYTKIRSGGFKADLLRYCVLYVNGGVYVDVDTVCLNSIDKIIDKKDELITVIDFNENPDEGQHNLANGFIAVKKEHPVLKMCIDKIVDNVMNDKKVSSMLDYTGPGLFGRCVNLYLNRQETDSFIGMEGRDDTYNIKFLKFERERELITHNNITVLQNKGGNQTLDIFYSMQCEFSGTKQQTMEKDNICILYNINPSSDSIKYHTWNDGFAKAVRSIVDSDFKIDLLNITDHKVIDFSKYEIVLFKETFNGDMYKRYSKKLVGKKLGLFISSSNIIPSQEQLDIYDILFFETYWYYNYAKLNRHPMCIHAFGVNTEVMKPKKCDKIYDNIFVGTIIGFKNPHKIIDKGGKNLCIGNIIDHSIEMNLKKNGIEVESYVDYNTLSDKYNQSKCCYLPCNLHGGGERAVLEARACGIPVQVNEDNDKLKELLKSPIYNHEYYKSQIILGLCKLTDKLYPKEIVNLIYHKERIGSGNFGDELSKFILGKLINNNKYKLITNNPDRKKYKNIIGIGSYIQCAPENCIIYGSGVRTNPPIEINSHTYTNLNVSAVRGPLTRDFLLNKDICVPNVYGDPALLLPLFYTPNINNKLIDKIGIIPHISNYKYYLDKDIPDNFFLISPIDKWTNIIDYICSCKGIISSSLHGLICSDAYNKPNLWLNEYKLVEGDFKIRDYFLSQNREYVNIKSIDNFDEEKLHIGNIIDIDRLKNSFPLI